MSNKLIKFAWNLGNITFHMCGLDKEKNFLESPKCECGCSEKIYLILNSKEEATDLAWQLVADNDCNCCAVFVILEDISVYETNKIEDYSDIGKVADELELHCYGLIAHVKENQYSIIEK